MRQSASYFLPDSADKISASMKLQMANRAQYHLLLLPGLDGSGRLFDPLLSVLPSVFDTSVVRYPPDQMRHPRDLLPCIRAVIPWGRPYVVVAESFAGPLALTFVEAQREDIRAVVLCASFVSNPAPVKPASGALKWARSFLPKSGAWLEKELTPPLICKHLLGEDAPPALLDQTHAALRSVKADVLASRVQMMLNVNARRELRDCEKPLLYLQASEDNFVGPEALEEIKRLKPSVKTAVVKGPHLLLQRNPREAIEAIRAFLNDLPPA
jgi:pimeloyl-ACP methyl ester carboxylesterase